MSRVRCFPSALVQDLPCTWSTASSSAFHADAVLCAGGATALSCDWPVGQLLQPWRFFPAGTFVVTNLPQLSAAAADDAHTWFVLEAP